MIGQGKLICRNFYTQAYLGNICLNLKELSFCHNFWFSNPFIFATQCCRTFIFQTKYSVSLNNSSLKYQRFTPSFCKDIGIRIFKFVAKLNSFVMGDCKQNFKQRWQCLGTWKLKLSALWQCFNCLAVKLNCLKYLGFMNKERKSFPWEIVSVLVLLFKNILRNS